jgi:hypothetical protein
LGKKLAEERRPAFEHNSFYVEFFTENLQGSRWGNLASLVADGRDLSNGELAPVVAPETIVSGLGRNDEGRELGSVKRGL